MSHRLVEEDPILAWSWEHLRRNPVPRGQRVLFSRAWLSRDFGEAPSPVQAASWLDIKRLYMDMRPSLRRIYSIVHDVETYGPMVGPLGLRVAPGPRVDFDGVPYYATQNDFGPSSIDGWLTRLVGAELQIEDDSILDRRPASTGPRWPARRPHEARVRRPELPRPAEGQGRRTFGSACGTCGGTNTPAAAT